MNIAEIRRKVRAGKSEHEPSVDSSPGEVLPPLNEASAPELISAQLQIQVPAPFVGTDTSRVKEVLEKEDDRLDQLFSWIPQQEEFLFEGSETRIADEKKVAIVSRRWLAFSLGSEDYALDISVIREILKPREITEIPRVPDFLLGIISLRGNIIPVFDLKRRLGLGKATIDQESRIIVCQEGERLAGLLIDRITQVTSIQDERIEPPPAIFTGRDRALLDGVGRIDGSVLILLNIANVLTLDANGL